jgi:hypothetical protein
MTSRAAKFLSAISASIVVSAPIAATPLRTVDAAVECLATRKGEAPAGQHWSYRFDRDTNRYCFHLRKDRAASSHATRSAPTRRAESHASAALPRATADAHAELPLQQSGFADGAQTPPMTPVGPNSVGQDKAKQDLANQDLRNQDLPNNAAREGSPSLVVSRWPVPTGVPSSAIARPTSSSFAVASATPDANAETNTGADLTSEAASAAPTRAETSIMGTPASLETFLLAAFGVITLSGFAGSSFVLRARMRRRPLLDTVRKPARPATSAHTRPPRWLGATAADDDDADVPAMFRPVTDPRKAREIAQLLARRSNRESVFRRSMPSDLIRGHVPARIWSSTAASRMA